MMSGNVRSAVTKSSLSLLERLLKRVLEGLCLQTCDQARPNTLFSVESPLCSFNRLGTILLRIHSKGNVPGSKSYGLIEIVVLSH